MVAAQSALMTVLVFISRRAKSSVFLSAFVFVFVYVYLSDDDRAKCVGCCLIGCGRAKSSVFSVTRRSRSDESHSLSH